MNLIDRAISASALLALGTLIVPGAGAAAAQQASKPTCSSKDQPASFDASYAPSYPPIAREEGARGTAVVRVALAPTGTVKSATIAHSSGFTSLDDAALDATRISTYKPETVACQAMPGEYLVEYDFDQS